MEPQHKVPDLSSHPLHCSSVEKHLPQVLHLTETWPECVDRTQGVLNALHLRHKMLDNDATPF